MRHGFSYIDEAKKSGNDTAKDFNYFVEQFDDIRVLRYRLDGFDSLSLKQKKYIYCLSMAALAGRDILWDQNFSYNLLIRKTLEAILQSHKNCRESEDYNNFLLYAKKVFFANGIHHHYSSDKFLPSFTKKYFSELVKETPGELLPLNGEMSADDLLSVLLPVIFDKNLFARKVERSEGVDIVKESAVNFYSGITQTEAETFYESKSDHNDHRPVAAGINSRVIKRDGKIEEEVYRSGGKYGEAIDRIVYWLLEAAGVAENEKQKKELALLTEYYLTGNLKTWDDYNVMWAKNTDSFVDYINGFVEVYEDPLGLKGTWESVVEYMDIEATGRAEKISANAQWFEDHSPVRSEHKKAKVTGVTAKVINVAMLGGDCYPVSPLGINLPNSNWIRKEVGSKSVRLGNITKTIGIASQDNGFLEEFAADDEEVRRNKKYETIADALHTDLHECVGHASGKLLSSTRPNALKKYSSALEEARADLFALYFIYDDKLMELGLVDTEEVAKTSYDSYIRNGLLTQMVRIKKGKDIEEAHMRNRAAIAGWVYETGKKDNVIEMDRREGKTFVRINDYGRLRELFGMMLSEVQRIKSEGDFEAGKNLIEEYGVKPDPALHEEVLERYSKLNLAPYTGFVNPFLEPVVDDNGKVTDIKAVYTNDFLGQMMYYGEHFSFLPVVI
ncbi:MAG TPA: hypothetical protein VJ963_11225 [Bacteroidales bacterium]|nr:hypothetical protein [Bacteroidales bacterium]